MITLTGLTKHYVRRREVVAAVSNVNLEVGAGEFLTLLGPSGCGKTTTLRLIAGLERPTAGEISIDGQVVCSPERRYFVGANRRPIGMVFQSYAVWPHMTVLENVLFPLTGARPSIERGQRRTRALEALELVGLADLAQRPAPMLSGGQQQRVALARALVRRPSVLLLDEPLSNLDAGLRDRMRDEIRGIQQRLGITTVFVTHDQDEALAISDSVVVMNQGNVEEQGRPQEIYASPRSLFAASFLGVANRLAGSVVAVTDDEVEVTVGPRRLHGTTREQLAVGDRVTVFLRPESLRLSRTRHSLDALPAEVALSIYHGDRWDYYVDWEGTRLRVRAYQEKAGLARGDKVFVEPEEGVAIVMRAGAESAVPDYSNSGIASASAMRKSAKL